MNHSRLTVVSLCIALAGCAVPTFEFASSQHLPISDIQIQVADGRVDKQTFMTAVTFTGQTHLYPLSPKPALDEALNGYIGRAVVARATGSAVQGWTVTIEDMDLKNLVGFGVADDLTCRIESKIDSKGATQSPRQVRTFSRNQSNRSPLVADAAEVIVQQCLSKHAEEIVDAIATQRGG